MITKIKSLDCILIPNNLLVWKKMSGTIAEILKALKFYSDFFSMRQNWQHVGLETLLLCNPVTPFKQKGHSAHLPGCV